MYIPDKVKRQLRSEIGFGCPVEGCGSPYLTYHHFDPPRRVKEHNEPAGMVALCRKHHDDAEGGAFTDDQLRDFKAEGLKRNQRIEGSFQWRRQQLLIHIGKTLTFEATVPLAFNGVPVVSLTRDDAGLLLVSINMLTTSIMPRLRMFENDWVSVGTPIDLEAPPFGRKLFATYPNGDRIKVEFATVDDVEALVAHLPRMAGTRDWANSLMSNGAPDVPALSFPAVLVDIELELPDAGVSITSNGVKTALSEIGDNYGVYGTCAVSLGDQPAPFPTMLNAIGVAIERPNLRFASMNDTELWNVSDRQFSRMGFFLDGYEFEECSFDQCWFALRGQSFSLKGNKLGQMTLMPSPEIQGAYNVIKALAEGGIPTFVAAAERLGQAASKGKAPKLSQND